MSSIHCPLQTNAQSIGNQPALIADRQTLSWEQLDKLVNAATTHFQETGIQKGTRVAILSETNVTHIVILLALWRIGALACLLNPKLPESTIQKQLHELKCSHILHAVMQYLSSQPEETRYTVDLDQEATIMFTSGSSAQPKAALHTYGNHFYSAKGANAHIPIAPGDRWLLSLPLYHVGGLSILFRILLGQGTIVIPAPKENISESIHKQNITHLSLVPTQFYRLLQEDTNFSSLKAILLGGSAIPNALVAEARQKNLPIHITYGLTEMSSQVATSDTQSMDAKILDYRQVTISDEGEILVKGKTLFKGYLTGDSVQRPMDNQGCFATGDLGHLTEEGGVKVTGRKDNMFISGGENIQPEEIEQYLCQVEGITQAIVVPIPNDEFGFRPIAFIQSVSAKAAGRLSKEKIRAYLKNHLPKYKCPDQFYPWPENAEADTIKIKRRYFQELVKREKG